MLSIIIPENKEGKEWVQKMVRQAEDLDTNNPYFKEVEILFATSISTCTEFCNKYELNNSKIPITIIPNIQNGGAARTYGGIYAKGDDLLFLDCHVCFDSNNLNILLQTLHDHPDSIVAPGYRWVEFPSCEYKGATIHGIYYRFTVSPFEWMYYDPAEKQAKLDKEFFVPFACACLFSMKKSLFSKFLEYGGFIGTDDSRLKKLGVEEEICMRLARLGHPTYIEPRSIFGHYWKSQPGHRANDDNIDQIKMQTIGIYISVFNSELWKKVETCAIKKWGNDKWLQYIEYAKQNYQWLRDKMEPFKNNIDETWFFRDK